MRACGILMPVFSLPGPFGIGTLGKEAFAFVDFLARAKQTYWQILPIGPTGYGDSPYQSFSAFAGNPYFIDFRVLHEQGYLTADEIPAEVPVGPVDYGVLYQQRPVVLQKAADRLLAAASAEYKDFCTAQSFWLDDYALFMAVKAEQGQAGLCDWPDDLRTRQPAAVAAARERLAGQVDYFKAVQFFFYTQWNALKAYANSKGIQLVGDIPIYVSPDSSDLWTHPELFQTDGQMHLTHVAGCPPDAFSETGQLWGNPLYRWEYHESTEFYWWISRIRNCFKWYDMVRIDHFRGFASYWSVPYGETTAKNGHWVTGPGMDLIDRLNGWFPQLEFIAEDLGYPTPEVAQLLHDSGWPGMKVLEFAFDSRDTSSYLPHTYTPHCICYTGTHDNSPLLLWRQEAAPEDIAYATEYLALTEDEGFHWGVIRGGMSSVAELFVAQVQDYLGLGEGNRMNIPGTQGGNWTWRLLPGELSDALSVRIDRMTALYGRKA